jgi:hypothetical protein
MADISRTQALASLKVIVKRGRVNQFSALNDAHKFTANEIAPYLKYTATHDTSNMLVHLTSNCGIRRHHIVAKNNLILRIAAKYGKLDVVQFLCDKYHLKKEDITYSDNCALRWATRFGQRQVQAYLLLRFDFTLPELEEVHEYASKWPGSEGYGFTMAVLTESLRIARKQNVHNLVEHHLCIGYSVLVLILVFLSNFISNDPVINVPLAVSTLPFTYYIALYFRSAYYPVDDEIYDMVTNDVVWEMAIKLMQIILYVRFAGLAFPNAHMAGLFSVVLTLLALGSISVEKLSRVDESVEPE